MRPMPFGQVMDWMQPSTRRGTIFGVRRATSTGGAEPIFGERMRRLWPHHGPNTQLAQNIVLPPWRARASSSSKTIARSLDGEGALRLREQALHRGRGQVLQLRVVHRAHGPADAAENTSRPGGPTKLVARGTGLGTRTASSSTCPWATASRASRAPRSTHTIEGHEGRLRERRLGGVPRLGARQPGPLPERRRRLRRVRLAGRVPLRHRVHTPRLPARRSSASPPASSSPRRA